MVLVTGYRLIKSRVFTVIGWRIIRFHYQIQKLLFNTNCRYFWPSYIIRRTEYRKRMIIFCVIRSSVCCILRLFKTVFFAVFIVSSFCESQWMILISLELFLWDRWSFFFSFRKSFKNLPQWWLFYLIIGMWVILLQYTYIIT